MSGIRLCDHAGICRQEAGRVAVTTAHRLWTTDLPEAGDAVGQLVGSLGRPLWSPSSAGSTGAAASSHGRSSERRYDRSAMGFLYGHHDTIPVVVNPRRTSKRPRKLLAPRAQPAGQCLQCVNLDECQGTVISPAVRGRSASPTTAAPKATCLLSATAAKVRVAQSRTRRCAQLGR